MNWKKKNSQLFYYQFSCLLKTLENILSWNARFNSRKVNLSGLFPFPVVSKCSISKHVSAATKAMNNIMAYETTSKLLSMRISLTEDSVFEAIMTGGGCLCPAAFSILLLNPTTLTRVYQQRTSTPVQPQKMKLLALFFFEKQKKQKSKNNIKANRVRSLLQFPALLVHHRPDGRLQQILTKRTLRNMVKIELSIFLPVSKCLGSVYWVKNLPEYKEYYCSNTQNLGQYLKQHLEYFHVWFNPWIRVPGKLPFGLQSTAKKWIISKLKWMKKCWELHCKIQIWSEQNLQRELLIRQTSTSQWTTLGRAGNIGITPFLSSWLGYRGRTHFRTSDISSPQLLHSSLLLHTT